MRLETGLCENTKNSILRLISTFLILLPSVASAQINVKYFNMRFTWIEVPSKYVKARLNKPIDGESICWIEAKTKKETIDFLSRRALPYERCLEIVLESRKILSKNKIVNIYGMGGGRDSKGEYSSLWDMIKGKNGCHGYFDDYCESYFKKFPEWENWKKNPIDTKNYP